MGRTSELRDTVNLSHTQLRKYLAFLEGSHLIILYREDPRGVSFSVTSKGTLVLQLVERLTAALTPGAVVEAVNPRVEAVPRAGGIPANPGEEPGQRRRA
jgi:predicted AAA+ superfamily ATPase